MKGNSMKTPAQIPGKSPGAAKAGVLVIGTCLTGWLPLAAQDTPPAKPDAEKKEPPLEKKDETEAAEESYNNWLTLSLGNFYVSGDRASAQRRNQIPHGPFGGVEDFHYEHDVGKKGLFKIDGHAIFDNHDYSLKLELSHPDKGYVRVGYKEFRTWYDGSGGYFPVNKQWFSLYDDEMHIDRGEVWFEGGLTLPNWPVITFKYTHQFRDGRKDSTIWGDTALTGLPGPDNVRSIVPAFRDIDESRDIFQADAKHTFGKTDVGLGLRYELVDNDNSLNIRRTPGESSDRYVTQKDKFNADLFNVHTYTETRVNDKVLFTTGYSFTKVDTDISGSRIYGPDYDSLYDPTFARRQFHDAGFLDLGGGSQVNQHVVNLNLMLTPIQNLVLVPSVRFEYQDLDGFARFTETDVSGPPNLTSVSQDLLNTSDRSFWDVTEALEARYTGLRNWAFYARGEWLEGDGDLKEKERDPNTGDVYVQRKTDTTRFTQKYTAGANWYPLQRLNFGTQYYHKRRDIDYDHRLDSTSNAPPSVNRYPAFITDQSFETDDVNFRVTWRPLNNVSLVSRYDFQISTIDTKADFLQELTTSKMVSHIFSQSATWSPISRLFLQGSINYTRDQTETPADNIVPGSSPVNRLVLKSKNNYWNASLTAGYALDDKTDLQAQYFYYRADDYSNNATVSQPYGADGEEHGVTVTLARQMTKALRWTLRYGYFRYRDDLYGGNNDYDAHLVYSSVQYRF